MKLFKNFLILFLLLSFLIIPGLGFSNRAQALPITIDPVPPIDPSPLIVSEPVKATWDWKKAIYETLSAVGFKQVLKAFVNRYAYDSAVYIASGGKGQKPLIVDDPWAVLKKSGDAALGDFVAKTAEDWTGINLCDISPLLKAKFLISIKEMNQPPFYEAERCSLSEIQENLKNLKLKDLIDISYDVKTNYVDTVEELDEILTITDVVDASGITTMISKMKSKLTPSDFEIVDKFLSNPSIINERKNAVSNEAKNFVKNDNPYNNVSNELNKLYSEFESFLKKLEQTPPNDAEKNQEYIEEIENKGLLSLTVLSNEYFFKRSEDFNTKDFTIFNNLQTNEEKKVAFILTKNYLKTFSDKSKLLKDKIDQITNELYNGEYQDVQPTLSDMAKMFNPEANDIGRFMALSVMAEQQAREKKEAEDMKIKLGQGFKNVETAVSGIITTPASVIQGATTNVLEKASIPESTYTGDLIADAIGIFTNTLTSKWIQRLFEKGLVPPPSGPPGQGETGHSIAAAKTVFSSINLPPPFNAGPVDVLAQLQTEGAIDSKFAQAIEQKLTVKEAIDQGFLNKEWSFGYTSISSEPESNQGYSATNMKKLRLYRIIPLGWEIASAKIYTRMKNDNKIYSLGEVVSGFDEKNGVFKGLVDPNWVLKAPEAYCKAKTFSDLKEGNADMRKETCADLQSCLIEKEDGTCQKFGYCLSEKNIWRFKGTKCEEQYQGCQTYKDSQSNEFSYLKDTLFGCSAQAKGCKKYFYADLWDKGNSTSTYLTNNAKTCPAKDAGCTKYIFLANNALTITEDDYFNENVYLNAKTSSCKSEEAGCKNYTRLSDNLKITGVLKNLCPSEAADCKQYFEYFEDLYGNDKLINTPPISFIQKKTKSCPVQDVTCEEYTNMESPLAQGEQLAYFKQNSVKQCAKEIATSTNCQIYYSWIGNIEQGYKLEVDNFAKATTMPEQVGYGTDNLETHCEKAVWENENALGIKFKTCQQYFDQNGGDHYFKTDFEFKPIICATDCTKFRRTFDQKTYFISPSEAQNCAVSSKGCTLYKTPQDEKVYVIKDSIAGARCEGFEGCTQYKENESGENFFFMQDSLAQIGCPAGCLKFINTKNTDATTTDAIINLVKTKENLCPESSQYCERLYSAKEDNQTTISINESENAETASSFYLFNDPNLSIPESPHPYYAKCDQNEVGCEEYTINNGKAYFKKPFNICSWQRNIYGDFKWLKSNGDECKDTEISTKTDYKMGYAKSCPKDMDTCNLYTDSKDSQKYFYLRKSIDASCYEENEKEGCKNFLDFENNNATTTLKVSKNRECAKWLDCISQNKVWDQTKQEYKNICYAFGSCDKLGPSSECSNYIDDSKNDGIRYDSITDITNYTSASMESGYSLLNQYPISRMVQVQKQGWTDFKLAINDKDSTSTDDFAEKSCRGYPESASPWSWKENKNYACEQDKNCDCSYKKVGYDDNREKFVGVNDASPAGFKDRKGDISVPVKENIYYGWKGYCLEKDFNLSPKGACLTWYPIDLAENEFDSFSSDFKIADMQTIDPDWKGNYGVEKQYGGTGGLLEQIFFTIKPSSSLGVYYVDWQNRGVRICNDEWMQSEETCSTDPLPFTFTLGADADVYFSYEQNESGKYGGRYYLRIDGQNKCEIYDSAGGGWNFQSCTIHLSKGTHIFSIAGWADKIGRSSIMMKNILIKVPISFTKVANIPTQNELGGLGIKLQTYKDYKAHPLATSAYHDFLTGNLVYPYNTDCNPFGSANLPIGCESGINGCKTAVPYYQGPDAKKQCKEEAGARTFYNGIIDNLRKLFVKGDIYGFNLSEFTNKCLKKTEPQGNCPSCLVGYNLDYQNASTTNGCNSIEQERCIGELNYPTIKKGYENGCLATSTQQAQYCPDCPNGFGLEKVLFTTTSTAETAGYEYEFYNYDTATSTDCGSTGYHGLCACQKDEAVEGYSTQCLETGQLVADCPVCPNGFTKQLYASSIAKEHGFRYCKTNQQLCVCKRNNNDIKIYPTSCQNNASTTLDCPNPARGFATTTFSTLTNASSSAAFGETWKCQEEEKACVCKDNGTGVAGYQLLTSSWNDMLNLSAGTVPVIHKAKQPDSPTKPYTDIGSGILINNKADNKTDGTITNEGDKKFVNAIVSFFAMADPDQVPIRRIEIDWNDGNGYKVMANGSFPNHVEDKTKLTDKYCKDQTICANTPFIFVNTYTQPGTFWPKVKVVDNWGREGIILSESQGLKIVVK